MFFTEQEWMIVRRAQELAPTRKCDAQRLVAQYVLGCLGATGADQLIHRHGCPVRWERTSLHVKLNFFSDHAGQCSEQGIRQAARMLFNVHTVENLVVHHNNRSVICCSEEELFRLLKLAVGVEQDVQSLFCEDALGVQELRAQG